MSLDIQRAREALYTIPADVPRDAWVRTGMAAQAAGLDFEEFNDWSAQAANYNERDARDTWRSFKPGKGITAGTLFHEAAAHGYRSGNPERLPAKPSVRHKAVKPRQLSPGMSPTELLASFELPTYDHGHIIAKGAAGVPLDGLRVVPANNPLRITGQSMAGALVVPAYGPDGLQSMQFIPEPGNGKKLNLPGAPMAGATYTVGEMEPGGVVLLCEGFGTACACWQATGHAAVVCFGWGNVRSAAAKLRQLDAAARIVLVPDVGKEDDADRIALEVSAAVARMPEGEPANFDANDLAQRDGRDVLAELLEGAHEPEKPAPRLKPISVADVLSNPSPAPAFVLEGRLPRSTVSLLNAHGGVGKSTVALMLVVAAVVRRPLFGLEVESCTAVFVSLEDGPTIVRHRLAYICRCWGLDPTEMEGRLHIVDGTEYPELFMSEARGGGETTRTFAELRELVQSVGAGLVVVDNASDAFGGDEIQRRQVRSFMRSLIAIAHETEAAVLLLAHVDKATSRTRKGEGGEGYSGSTAWHNSARSRLFMSRAEDGTLTLEHQKSNFGKLAPSLTLTWPDGGLPDLAQQGGTSAFGARLEGRVDDDKAIGLLRILAEFESRGQYCSPVATARNNVFAILRSEPAFQSLRLSADACRRIVNQCQRAGWIEVVEYRTHDRKTRPRWTLTPQGRVFADGSAPSAPCAPSSYESAQSARGAPCAPSYAGGMGESAHMLEVGK